MLESLDNPIWSALTTEHRLLACSHGLARRYSPDVSPFAAFLHPTKDAFADLQRLVSPGEHIAFFTASPFDVPGGWQVDPSRWIVEASVDARPVTLLVDTGANKTIFNARSLIPTLTVTAKPGPSDG